VILLIERGSAEKKCRIIGFASSFVLEDVDVIRKKVFPNRTEPTSKK
jgi:hypothetical protein